MTGRIGRSVGLSASVIVALAALFPGLASSEETTDPEDKPFAEHRVILQLSDTGAEKQRAVLDVANNLISHYAGPERVDIEIVTFGSGVELLFEGNPNAARISSLVENGVRFYVCERTLESLAREGTVRPLLDAATLTSAGVPHILERVSRGFVLVKP